MTAALLSFDEIRRGLIDLGVPESAAERSASDEIARRVSYAKVADHVARELREETGMREIGSTGFLVRRDDVPAIIDMVRQSKTIVKVGTDRYAICQATLERDRDQVTAVFALPPRTKKNSIRWFGKQSIAYTRYRDAIVAAVAESKRELQLPLPDQPYNLEAVFYVDSPGERADLFGLLQGIADALQDAGVVSNDWHFRTTDRSRIVIGDETPRVQVTITPTED